MSSVVFACGEEELDFHARISWGGGAASSWSGTITLSSGKLLKTATLGLEADAPGSILSKEDRTLLVQPRSPNGYGGVDVHLLAPRDATLHIEFTSEEKSAPVVLTVRVASLLREKTTQALDQRGNRLAVQRAPSDALRITTERKQLLFRTGEEWQGRITPHLFEEAANSTTTLAVTIRSLSTNAVVLQEEQAIALDATGSGLQSLAWKTPLTVEGAYELTAELRSRPLVSAIVRPKVLVTRRLQCVAIDSQAATVSGTTEWKEVEAFDPTTVKNGERGLPWPQLKLGSNNKTPLGNDMLEPFEHAGTKWMSLRAGGWQAYPLAVQQLNQPHLLEIEYPSDVPQTLGMSVIDPNSVGQVVPLGVDAGIDVTDPLPGALPTLERQRILFWPRSKSPLILLTNRRADRAAVFGKIRLLAGPTSLPHQATPAELPSEQRRWLAAFYERPLFPENFSVTEAMESKQSRSYDDWHGFFQGSRRLVEYLRYAGLNSVILPVNSEGSSLYPSELLDPTPKYESGAFAEQGGDLVRKDVFELLLRELDRQGLTGIPALSFSSPLSELEELKTTLSPREQLGLELLGSDGRSWLQTQGPRRGQAPYYNLLDPRVQEAMRRVVLELANRYHEHPSLGGIAIQLSGDGYAQLPDDTWGLDETTLARFSRETKIPLPPLDPADPQARWLWVQKEARTAWLTWRAEQVTEFYRNLRSDLNLFRPELKLLLCPLEPVESRRMEHRLRPSLPSRDQMQEGFLSMGLDPVALSQIPGVIFSRVWRESPTPELGQDGVQLELNDSPWLDAAAAMSSEHPATILLSQPLPLRLEAFDKVHPFGPQTAETFLLTQASPVGKFARKRITKSLATVDTHLLASGGWMLPLGQEDAVRPLLHTLSQIPAAPFETLVAPPESRTQPVVLRRWSNQDATWFYWVNHSAWPVIVDVEFHSATPIKLQAVNANSPPAPLPTNQNLVRWRVRIEPYDVVAAKLEQPAVTVAQWRTQVEQIAELTLKEQIRDVRLRANNLRVPMPINTLKNLGFEEPVAEQVVSGWTTAQGPGIVIEADRRLPHGGSQALHVVSRAPDAQTPAPVVWLRSQTLPTPRTGRLALWVWLRTRDAKQQPHLRLAIEGKLEGQPYYRRANIGASEDGRPVQPLREEWSPFLFPLDDLPTEGLTDLQVGFDLMGAGEIWLDDVQVYQLWFQESERDALLKSIAVADFQLQAGKVRDCSRFLESYWPQFLRKHVALNMERVAERVVVPVAANLPSVPAPPAAKTETKTPEPEKNNTSPAAAPSMLERLKQWTPRLPFQ